MKRRILIVEDDGAFSHVLCHFLMDEGFDVQAVRTGNDALAAANQCAPDLALLDLTLPGRSGFEVCAAWQRGRRFPIIIITSRVQKSDELRGFDLGADDYLTKPFDLDRLLARINAVLRRVRVDTSHMVLGDVQIDFAALTATRNGAPLELSHREFELLRHLAERTNQVVTRDELLREVWQYADAAVTRSVDMAVTRLRKKLEADSHHPRFLHTARGGGYVLTLTATTGGSERD